MGDQVTLLTLATILQVVSLISIIGEIPTKNGSFWQLQHLPSSQSIACYRNGLRQKVGVDFTLSQQIITSTLWDGADTLLCDYTYLSRT